MRWISLVSSGHSIQMQKNTYTFFSSAHGIFSRIDHILGHESNLSKFKKIKIISSIFSDHKPVRLDINYKKKTVRKTDTWRLNNMFLNNQQVTVGKVKANQKAKRQIKKFLETNDNENTTTQNLSVQFSSVQSLSRVRLFATP